jgi:hypothetical protein
VTLVLILLAATSWDAARRAFWDVLDSSGRSLRVLWRRLEALPREQLYSFQYQYWEAMDYVRPDPRDMPSLSPTVRVPADLDEEDFDAWVVSQGRAFYYDLRRQPERLQACIDMYVASEEGRGFLELRWDETVDREGVPRRAKPVSGRLCYLPITLRKGYLAAD